MTSRGRRLATLLPVVVTLLIATVVGALILVEDQRQGQLVAAADQAAEDFLSDVGMFRGDVAREVRAARETLELRPATTWASACLTTARRSARHSSRPSPGPVTLSWRFECRLGRTRWPQAVGDYATTIEGDVTEVEAALTDTTTDAA